MMELDITIRARNVVRPPLWRVKHDLERGALWRESVPEVYLLKPGRSVLLTASLQWLWKDMNPAMSGDQWAKLLGNDLAFTNGTGFPGHADLVNGRELDAHLPLFDQERICGGAVVTGREDGDRLWLETVTTREPIPSAGYVMSRPWLRFAALNVKEDGSNSRFPQGGGQDVWVPLLAAEDVWLPLNDLVRIADDEPIPSPYLWSV